MDFKILVDELDRYEAELTKILSRFSRTSNGIHINRDDDANFRQYAQELVDLFKDALGQNPYSQTIAAEFSDGVSNWLRSPSYKSVENIRSTLRAARTRFVRGPEMFAGIEPESNRRRRENIFIVHGHDEAKRRELTDLLRGEFGLNPIVLAEQPDAGCRTIIEKFECYAPTCSYAIAIFTPDDEVSTGGETYYQGRPNVIYELGWFCGSLGRSRAMLLLKEGTSLFSDFGGIIQKRFIRDISEKALEIRRELVFAGVADEA